MYTDRWTRRTFVCFLARPGPIAVGDKLTDARDWPVRRGQTAMRRRLTYRRRMCFRCADRVVTHSQPRDRAVGSCAPRNRARRNSAVRVGSPASRLDLAFPPPLRAISATSREWCDADRDCVMGRYHFDIGVVSVFVKFVI